MTSGFSKRINGDLKEDCNSSEFLLDSETDIGKMQSQNNDSDYLHNQRKEASKILQTRESLASNRSKNRTNSFSLRSSSEPDLLVDRTPQLPVSCIPSKFLRPNDFTPLTQNQNRTDSTVNESDLFKSNFMTTNTSTPRQTLSSCDSIPTDICDSLRRLSQQIKDPGVSLASALQKLNQEYDRISNVSMKSISSEMFQSAEEAQERLLKDENSWRKKRELSIDREDFSIASEGQREVSIGDFFKQRSDNVSDLIPGQISVDSIEIPDDKMDIEKYFKRIGEKIEASNISSDSLDLMPTSDKNSIASGKTSIRSSDLSSSTDLQLNESLSVTKLNEIIASVDGTPGKMFDNFMEKCMKPKKHSQKLADKENISTRELKKSLECGLSDLQISRNSILNENTSRNVEKISSITASRSSSVLSTLPGGKLPIETNQSELIWGCVKPGKSDTRQFFIRNRTSNRIRFQCSIAGPFFKIVNDSESSNQVKYTLHGNEMKTVLVSFNPISDGFASDEIVFISTDPDLQQTKKQSLHLFGYGGTSQIAFRKNVSCDISGQHFISIGCVDFAEDIFQSFEITNQGSLSSFFLMEYFPKNNLYFPDITIQPVKWVLKPGETKVISMEYKYTKSDIKYLQSLKTMVSYIGTLKITSGAEIVRSRIKNLTLIAKEKNFTVNTVCKKLSDVFPGENDDIDAKSKFTESFNNFNTLLQILNNEDMIISLKQDLNKTFVPISAEDTTMFQSLFVENTIIENSSLHSKLKLEPSLIILSPPNKISDLLVLSSDVDRPLHFKLNVPDCFKFTPGEGVLQPSETKIIKINICKLDKKLTHTIAVHVEDVVLFVNVKIVAA